MRRNRGDRAGGRGGASAAAAAALLIALAAAAPVAAQDSPARSATPAGTVVANTAAARWTIAGAPADGWSNTDRLVVAERLDVRLAASATAGPGATAFLLTNAGTGAEAFVLAATDRAAGVASPVGLAEDVDRDGRYDPAIDRPLAGDRTAPLAPGATLALLALADGPLRIDARAGTGSGAPGTTFQGAGDGGGDAVVGPTGAAATLVVEGAGLAASLVKSQAVSAPDGGTRPVAGATVTYTLAARFPAGGVAAAIEDPLPVGTRFVPGSLRLDGAPLSDAADADAGEVADGRVRVRLGDPSAGADHTVTFAVTLL